MGVFDQGGGKSAKFEQPGDQIVGTVMSVAVVPKTKFGTSDPDYWKSGDPIMQAKVVLQTDDRIDGDDDGVRNLFATISSTEGGKFRVIQDAIAEAHGKRADLEPGAKLGLRFTGYDPNSANPQNPRKLFVAMYQKPDGAFGGQPQQAPAQQPQQQFPATQTALPVQQPQQQGGWQQGPPQAAPAAQQPAAQLNGQQWGQVQQAAAQPQFQQQPAQDPWTGQPAQQPQQFQQPQQGGFGQPQGQPAFDPATGELGQQGIPQPGFYGNQPQPPAQQFQQPQAPQQQAPVPAQQPAAQQVVTVDQQRVLALIQAQMPDQVIMEATGISPEALNMARNASLQGGAPGGMPQ